MTANQEANEAADDYIDACYAEWLIDQPEANITGGDVLVQRMEAQWGWDRFMAHFTSTHNDTPEAFRAAVDDARDGPEQRK